MLFNSLQFVVFFVAVFLLYYALPHRLRWALLLAASCYFYMAFVPRYILILGYLIVSDYLLALCIERSRGRGRRAFLAASILANLGVLGFFKYFNFFNANVAHLAHLMGWNYSYEALSILLPLGLSFHVFQSLSYIIEVYKGRHPAERHLGIYALYVMFFPQLMAGPIERPQHLLPQLKAEHGFDQRRILEGLTLTLFGFFKKVVIADGLSLLVDHVFADSAATGITVFIAVIAFSYQLYCDFSGYSDIALGAARMLGIELTPHFDRPYASRSITEFWRRWHMSLSSWLRDYLYSPLAFRLRRFGKLGLSLSLFITFVLIGLWHGAGWTYVTMGAIHGAYLVFGPLTKAWRTRFANYVGLIRVPAVYGFLQQITTFGLVSFSWIFFRANTIREAAGVVRALFHGWSQVFHLHYIRYSIFTFSNLGLYKATLCIIALSIVIMELFQKYQLDTLLYEKLQTKPRWIRWGVYYGAVFWILCFGYFGNKYFLYFQF